MHRMLANPLNERLTPVSCNGEFRFRVCL